MELLGDVLEGLGGCGERLDRLEERRVVQPLQGAQRVGEARRQLRDGAAHVVELRQQHRARALRTRRVLQEEVAVAALLQPRLQREDRVCEQRAARHRRPQRGQLLLQMAIRARLRVGRLDVLDGADPFAQRVAQLGGRREQSVHAARAHAQVVAATHGRLAARRLRRRRQVACAAALRRARAHPRHRPPQPTRGAPRPCCACAHACAALQLVQLAEDGVGGAARRAQRRRVATVSARVAAGAARRAAPVVAEGAELPLERRQAVARLVHRAGDDDLHRARRDDGRPLRLHHPIDAQPRAHLRERRLALPGARLRLQQVVQQRRQVRRQPRQRALRPLQRVVRRLERALQLLGACRDVELLQLGDELLQIGRHGLQLLHGVRLAQRPGEEAGALLRLRRRLLRRRKRAVDLGEQIAQPVDDRGAAPHSRHDLVDLAQRGLVRAEQAAALPGALEHRARRRAERRAGELLAHLLQQPVRVRQQRAEGLVVDALDRGAEREQRRLQRRERLDDAL